MKRTILTSLLATSIAVVSMAHGADKAAALMAGKKAPALTVLKWVKGQPVSTFERGKVYVVEFWATWCGPCKVSIPHLTELAKKYAGKATFTGVSVWEDTGNPMTADALVKKVSAFVQTEGDQMNYNVAVDGPSHKMAATWMTAANQNGIPTAFVVGKDGMIAWIGHPMVGLDEAVGQIIADKFDRAAEVKRELDVAKAAAEEQAKQAEEQKYLQPLIEAIKAKDDQKVLAELDKLLPAHPEMQARLAPLKFQTLEKVDVKKAQAYANELAAGLFKGQGMFLNYLAWDLVDEPLVGKGVDYAQAETLAKAALDASSADESTRVLVGDTYSMALYRNGKVDEAIKNQKQVIEDGKKLGSKLPQNTVAEFEAHLAKFSATSK